MRAGLGVVPVVDQQVLVTALTRVRQSLEAHGGTGPQQPAAGVRVDEDEGLSALAVVCRAFDLSPFERDTLLLAAGPELDGSFGDLCARAHGDDRRPYPTLGLALAALPDAHWSAISPSASLRRWHLVELADPTSPTGSRLVIDEYVLHLLAGAPVPDPRLRGVVTAAETDGALPPSMARDAERLAGMWADGPDGARACLTGRDRSARRGVAAHAADLLGLSLVVVDAALLRSEQPDLEVAARLLERTALLEGRAVLVEDDGPAEGSASDPAGRSAGPWLLESIRMPVALSSQDPMPGRRAVVVDVRRPTSAEQKERWRQLLGGDGAPPAAELDELVAVFDLDPGTIRTAAGLVRADDGRTTPWEACRAVARPRLGTLASRVEPAVGWDDLVLPSAQKDLLREMASQVRHRGTVYGTWGLRTDDRGLGTAALFCGPSGTGKTMAAEVLAAELQLDLFRVDLSAVMSKYIGETEKNLRQLFDAADDGAAVLLFDEADALFGKRTEVKDSHDRYANVEVSYLLQRMEQYRGLAILTTNHREALDTAFLRRIRFVVDFPFPDIGSRSEIWRRVFPEQTPTADLDWELLARLNLTGAAIRSVAVGAAFRAASNGGVVRMPHLVRAARTELAKLDLSSRELEGLDL